MSLYALDASVWVSRLVVQDVFHQKVSQWLTAQLSTGADFVSPALLLAEVGGAISRRTSTKLGRQALNTLQVLPGIQLVQMDENLMRLAAQLAADLGVRGAVSTYVAVASSLNIPLVTLDKDQARRASKVVATVSI